MSASSEIREQERLQTRALTFVLLWCPVPCPSNFMSNVAHKVCMDFVAGESVILTTEVAEFKHAFI